MAEIIFKTTDNISENAAEDRAGCYKRGYAISVCRDGWQWTDTERSAAYRIVKIPDVTVDRIVQSGILDPELDPLSTVDDPIVYRRRRYKLDLDRWTVADDNALIAASTENQKIAILTAKVVDLSGT